MMVASLLPPSLGGRGGTLWHLIGYGALAALLAGWQPGGRAAALAWGYGVLLEGLQGLAPYRTAEAWDLAVNAGAVAVGLVVRAAVARGVRQ